MNSSSESDRKIKEAAREISHNIANRLQQEHKFHEGQWWLFTLGKPARPLTVGEVAEAAEDGRLPE